MNITNQYFVVRHGESENNVLQVDSSKLENKDKFGLTEKGRKETLEEAQKFIDFDLIFSSPFKRTKETSHIFAETSQCEVIEHDLLREVCVGDFEFCEYGLSDAFFEKHNDKSIPFPNGESLLDGEKRAVEFFDDINQKYNNKKILIVTHGWIVLFLLEYTQKDFDRKKYLAEYDEARKVVRLC